MCGIIGIVNPKTEQDFQLQLNKIRHRGPDDDGTFFQKNVALGHQRLSILDLSPNGHQPMFSEDGRYAIIFNGEIYNHLEIREEFKDKYTFKSTSDTETLLYGYIEYGTDLFKRLNGIFAFAIYDLDTKELCIVRDHFGIKPLYYYKSSNQLVFSSELKAITHDATLNKDIDYESLVSYLNFLWSPGESTPFKQCKKLLSGHYIRLNTDDLSTFKITKYYDIPFIGKYEQLSEQAWIDKVDVALTKAVERQLLSDVPVGFFLSGGLDSSLIVALAAKVKGNTNFNCYTIATGNEEEEFEGFTNDLHYARKVAQHIGVNLLEVEAKSDIVRDFDKMIWHLDEPQADAAPLNVLNICKQARANGDIVLLGGTAGDDLFSGYRRHQALQFEKYFSVIPRPLGRVIKTFTQKLNNSNATNRRIRKITSHLDASVTERMASYYQWIPLEVNKGLFKEEIFQKIKDFDPQHTLIQSLENIPNEHARLNQMLYWDMKYFLTDHNLNYTDKLSMAEGIEVRVPFLDKDLVELSTQIPIDLKLKGNETKYILKKVAERYLPKEVIYRPKSGFGAPVRDWITGDLKPIIEERLSKSALEKQGLFDYESVQKLIHENQIGKIDASYTIWSVLAISSWFNQFA